MTMGAFGADKFVNEHTRGARERVSVLTSRGLTSAADNLSRSPRPGSYTTSLSSIAMTSYRRKLKPTTDDADTVIFYVKINIHNIAPHTIQWKKYGDHIFHIRVSLDTEV